MNTSTVNNCVNAAGKVVNMRDVHRSLSFKESDENIDRTLPVKKRNAEKKIHQPNVRSSHSYLSSLPLKRHFEKFFSSNIDRRYFKRAKHLRDDRNQMEYRIFPRILINIFRGEKEEIGRIKIGTWKNSEERKSDGIKHGVILVTRGSASTIKM